MIVVHQLIEMFTQHFYQQMLVQEYLNHLEQADFNVFDPTLRKRERRGWHTLKLLWKIYRQSKSGTVPFE